MRKVSHEISKAFDLQIKKKIGNTETDGKAIYLHGNKIAEWRETGVYITNCGWFTNTTKDRLNALRGVSIKQIKGAWYLNGKEWNGEWIKV
jgi:hypothetical protein